MNETSEKLNALNLKLNEVVEECKEYGDKAPSADTIHRVLGTASIEWGADTRVRIFPCADNEGRIVLTLVRADGSRDARVIA